MSVQQFPAPDSGHGDALSGESWCYDALDREETMNSYKLQLTEYCQKCQNAQSIKGTTVTRKIKTSDGKTKAIVTVSYHCEACNAFIRSEEHASDEENL